MDAHLAAPAIARSTSPSFRTTLAGLLGQLPMFRRDDAPPQASAAARIDHPKSKAKT